MMETGRKRRQIDAVVCVNQNLTSQASTSAKGTTKEEAAHAQTELKECYKPVDKELVSPNTEKVCLDASRAPCKIPPPNIGLSLSHELGIELRNATKVPRGVESRAFTLLQASSPAHSGTQVEHLTAAWFFPTFRDWKANSICTLP